MSDNLNKVKGGLRKEQNGNQGQEDKGEEDKNHRTCIEIIEEVMKAVRYQTLQDGEEEETCRDCEKEKKEWKEKTARHVGEE